MPKINTILFDCDNTLVLSEELAFEACADLINQICAERGIPRRFTGESLLVKFVDQNFRSMLNTLQREVDINIAPDEMDQYVRMEEDVRVANEHHHDIFIAWSVWRPCFCVSCISRSFRCRFISSRPSSELSSSSVDCTTLRANSFSYGLRSDSVNVCCWDPPLVPSQGGQRVKWALRDKAKYTAQVETLSCLVQDLHNLVPPERAKGTWSFQRGAQSGSLRYVDDFAASNGSWALELGRILAGIQKELEAETRKDLSAWLQGHHTPNELCDDAIQNRLDGTCDWILEPKSNNISSLTNPQKQSNRDTSHCFVYRKSISFLQASLRDGGSQTHPSRLFPRQPASLVRQPFF